MSLNDTLVCHFMHFKLFHVICRLHFVLDLQEKTMSDDGRHVTFAVLLRRSVVAVWLGLGIKMTHLGLGNKITLWV